MLRDEVGAIQTRQEVRRVIILKKRAAPPSQAELLDELERVWKLLGRRPTYGEFKGIARIALKAYERSFGSWKGAISALSEHCPSLERGTRFTNMSRELLEKDLRSIACQHTSEVFQYKDYRRLGGVYSIGTFQNHFGSWHDAVLQLGMKDGHSRVRPDLRHYSDEDYFAEMQRIWEELGRQPAAREIRQLSSISPQAFQHRFGSWIKAVHAFCADRSGLSEPYPVTKPESEAHASRPTSAPSQNGICIDATQADTVRTGPPAPYPLPTNPGIDAPANRSANAPSQSGMSIDATRADTVVIIMTTPRQPSLRLRFQVLKRDSFTCVACGRSPAKQQGVQLHVDHVMPYSRGGETILENLQTLCEHCNLGKSDDLPGP